MERLQKEHMPEILQAIEDLKLKAVKTGSHIDILSPTGQTICSLIWQKANPPEPGRWILQAHIADVWSHTDIKPLITFANTLHSYKTPLQKAFQAFLETKSGKRWKTYFSTRITMLTSYQPYKEPEP